jgi:hypothetical protein
VTGREYLANSHRKIWQLGTSLYAKTRSQYDKMAINNRVLTKNCQTFEQLNETNNQLTKLLNETLYNTEHREAGKQDYTSYRYNSSRH